MSEAVILDTSSATPEHRDILIVGAGISGIGGAVHLKNELPNKTFLILENQDSFGGTWKTHTYPGIRSDSDLFTFGYKFKPWTGKPIASAGAYSNICVRSSKRTLSMHIFATAAP